MALSRNTSLMVLALGLIVLVAGLACVFLTDIKDLYLYVVAALGVIIALVGGYYFYESRKVYSYRSSTKDAKTL